MKLSSPSAQRNREPIAAVLAGEHAVHFARDFPQLAWQPSDPDPAALTSIEAWRADSGLPNLREPVILDASSETWPVAAADAVLNINMVHISPWDAALGLLEGSARVLADGAPLILYGPWLAEDVATAPSNLAFDADLKRRDPAWGLRRVEDFALEAEARGFRLADQRAMPANNRMLLFRRG
jgi:hypothetical protein